jgi:predicted RND superfamily exporter protein
MAFAPMPLFAAYGLLTAVMIVFAATAALVVLPPLLMLVTSERALARSAPRGAPATTEGIGDA